MFLTQFNKFFMFQVSSQNNKLLLNNASRGEEDRTPHPLNFVNNLHSANPSCNKCKELTYNNKSCIKDIKGYNNKGFINLGFVDALTEECSWYQPYIQREVAVKVLVDCPVGSFVIRHSQTHGTGTLALTVRVPKSFNGTGILHYLVVGSEAGWRIKGFTKVFPNLSALVVHHSVMKESLPCRLVVEDDGSCGGDSDRESDFADIDSDPDFPIIIDRLREQLSQ